MAQATSGQITVTTAGTEVQGPDIKAQGFFIKGKTTNTGLGYVGNDGAGVVHKRNYKVEGLIKEQDHE